MGAVPADDVGRRRCVISDERWERTKRRSRIRSTKQGFVKKNVRGFRYKPRGDWFSFGKVRKLCFLCSYKQMLFFARLTHTCAAPVSYVIRRKGSLLWTRIRQIAEVAQNCLYRFENIFFFFLQKRIDSLQEAFIHPHCACEARFFMDSRTLFYVFWTV